MKKTLATLTLLLGCCGLAHADEVLRHRPPGSTFPIASAVEVPAGKTLVYLSGAVPPVVDEKAERGSLAAYGDTRTQTAGTLAAIERNLKSLGLGMGDVVKMQVFLVGDPAKGGKMDFDGFMAAYREHFGTAAQPRLPARSVMQVAALVVPGWLVEIEVTAVRP
jgi:enamine deaminase RidA (YjgF/YER057c/UK114 family)